MKINRPLLLLVIAAVLPLVILSAVLAAVTLRQQQLALQQDAMSRVRLVATMVERDLQTHVTVLTGMARSPRFDRPIDPDDFVSFFDRIRQGQPRWINVSLSDVNGRRLADSPAIPDAPAFVTDRVAHARAVATGQPAVGAMMRGAHGRLGFAVSAPVVREGRVRYVFTAMVEPDGVGTLLRTDGLPAGWRASVLDGEARLVARAGPATNLIGTVANHQAVEARRRGLQGLYNGVSIEGRPTFTAYRVIPRFGWSVHVAMPLDLYRAPVSRAAWLIAGCVLAGVALAGIFLFLLVREFRLRQREDAALERARRMEAIGRMTGGVAHDFNNILMIVQGSAEMLKRRRADADRVVVLADAVLAAAQRGQALTRQLLAFARRDVHEPTDFTLQSRAAAIADFLGQAVGGTVALEVSIPDEVWPVHADPNALEIALINLAVNARDAMPDGGRLTVSAANVELHPGRTAETVLEGDYVQILVQDTGEGIAEDNLPHIFEPFFTTKPAGKGTGLGLSQVYGFAKQSGGSVTVASRLGVGTAFAVYLPRARAATEAPAVERAETAGADGRLLVVDDEAQVRTAVAAMLEGAGYTVVAAASAAEAVERLESGEDFDAMLSDVVMPGGLSGLELAARARTLRPDLAVVLMTGYSEALARGAGCPWTVLSKPFAVSDAVQALTAARLAARRPVEATLRA